MTDKLVLIDGNSLINRAFYALPPSMTARDGTPTNAVYGFTGMLLKMIEQISPEYLAVVFDLPFPTFRHLSYDLYKATRKPMPEELRVQMPLLKDLLAAMHIKCLSLKGFEADDVIGTVAKKESVATVIVTGDKDSLQLVDASTTVHLTKRGITEVETFDPAHMQEVYGFEPCRIIDLKALMGDASDNIPGVPGVGEKTAQKLLADYGSLDSVYQNLDKIVGGLHAKLESGKDSAYMSYRLATIDTNVPIVYELSELRYDFPFSEEVREKFETLAFKTYLNKDVFGAGEKPAVIRDIPVTMCPPSDVLTLPLEKGFAFFVSDDFVSVAADVSREYRFNVNVSLLDGGATLESILAAFGPLLENKDVPKTVFDTKALKHRLARLGIGLSGVDMDVQLAEYVSDCTAPNSAVADILSTHALEEFSPYPSCGLAALKPVLTDKLKDFVTVYRDIEVPLVDVLYGMEERGFSVDVGTLDRLGAEFNTELDRLRAAIFEQAGETFNINSTKQLGVVLFDHLGLNSTKKTKGKQLSTDSDVLESLKGAHPVVDNVIRYRTLTKLNGTYIDGVKKLLDENNVVHTVFKQTVTSTGRLSSVEPNLQNIPIREEEGRNIRKMFVAREGCTLVSADYSQIELRLLAHFSNNDLLIQSFIDGTDIHTRTASDVFGVPIGQVTKAMRRDAKAVNFGVIYGISDFGLSSNLGISVAKAHTYITSYFDKYPSVKAYLDDCIARARRDKKLSTVTGRVRMFRDINSSNYQLRSFNERAAMNLPLQGSAADLIKIAMVNVSRALKKEGLDASLLLQVHDELIIEAPDSEVDIVKVLLRREMENAMELSVPLVAEVSAAKNWYDLK